MNVRTTSPSSARPAATRTTGRGTAAARQPSNNATMSLGLHTILSPIWSTSSKAAGCIRRVVWASRIRRVLHQPDINYGYGDYNDNYELPNSRKQPIVSVSDTMTWMKGPTRCASAETCYREVNQYRDPPEGYTIIDLGLAEGDPARKVLTQQAIRAAAGPGAPLPTDAEWANARNLYAMLTGRISGFSGPPRLRPLDRQLRHRQHAGPQRRRVLDARRTADNRGDCSPRTPGG